MIVVRQQHGMRHRVRQFFTAVSLHESAAVDAEIRTALNDDRQWRLVQRLSPADRAHVLTVYRSLRQRGYDDEELLRAALLHDVGKVDERGRVRLIHRVVHVLGTAISPRLAQWVSSWSHGMYLARNHAWLGAELARDAGASVRCCWLIAHHEDSEVDDAALRALITADSEAVR